MEEEKNKGGRPKIYDPEKIADDLEAYLNSTDDPYVDEFVLTQPFTRDTLYRLEKENERLSDNIKRVHLKQQMRTVKKAEAGEINTTFAIFKLKQKCYGWTDRMEVESTNTNLNYNYEKELSELIK